MKLRKARDSHQDDLEALARLWPVDTGFVLPTMLKPYADVLRIEREAREERENEAAGERPLDKLDTDSEDEEAYMHRKDMIEEIARLRKEAVFPSIRNIDPEEAPRFKVVSTTPRRRRFLLWTRQGHDDPPDEDLKVRRKRSIEGRRRRRSSSKCGSRVLTMPLRERCLKREAMKTG